MLKDLKNFYFCFKWLFGKTPGKKIIFLITWASFLIIISQAFQFLIPFLSKFVIDSVIVDKNTQILPGLALIVFVSIVLGGIINVFANTTYFSVFYKTGIKFKNAFCERLLYAPVSFHHRNTKGDSTFRLTVDTEKIISFLAQFFATLPLCIIIIIAAIVMMRMNLMLGLLIYSILILHALVILIFNKPIYKISYLLKEISQRISSYLVELFSRIETVKVCNAENLEMSTYDKLQNDQYTISRRMFLVGKYSETMSLIVNNL